MNKTQIIELFKVNLLYANPPATLKLRKKNKEGKELFKSLLNQYILLGLIFTFLYSTMMFSIDFPNYPGYFTYYCMLYTLMAISQSISGFFNIFFDSKDLKDYLPLPFTMRSVYMAKFLTVSYTVIPFLLPVLGLFLLTGIKSGLPTLVGIPISLIMFVLFFFIIMGLSSIFVSLLVQTNLFNKYKKLFTTLLILIPSVGMVVGMLYFNTSTSDFNELGATLIDQPILYPFYPFYVLLANPFSSQGLFSILGLAVVLFIIFIVISNKIIPKMTLLATTDGETATNKIMKKAPAYKSLTKQLINYNFGLIKNPNLMIQIFSTAFVFPIIFIFPMLTTNVNLSDISLGYSALFVLSGFFFSFLTVGGTSILGLIISLDRENYSVFKSLPIDFEKYLTIKFYFALIFQFVLNSVIIIAISFFLHIPFLHILSLLAGNIMAIYLCGLYFFYRDYRLLTLNWTNISQLFGRGGGNFTVMLSLFGTIFVGALVMGVTFFALIMTSAHLIINLITWVILISVSIAFHYHYKKVFWNKL